MYRTIWESSTTPSAGKIRVSVGDRKTTINSRRRKEREVASCAPDCWIEDIFYLPFSPLPFCYAAEGDGIIA